MDNLQKTIQDVVEGQIDFAGQRLTELISTVMLIATSVIALLAGFLQKDIHLTMWIALAGTFLTLLVVVPPWPSFNRNPEAWLGSHSRGTTGRHAHGLKVS